jgi:hypothetical protein
MGTAILTCTPPTKLHWESPWQIANEITAYCYKTVILPVYQKLIRGWIESADTTVGKGEHIMSKLRYS